MTLIILFAIIGIINILNDDEIPFVLDGKQYKISEEEYKELMKMIDEHSEK